MCSDNIRTDAHDVEILFQISEHTALETCMYGKCFHFLIVLIIFIVAFLSPNTVNAVSETGSTSYNIMDGVIETTAYVTGEEKDDQDPVLVIVNSEQAGLDRKELYVGANDIKQTYKDEDNVEHTLTDAEYEQALRDRGTEKLEQFAVSQAFSSEINVGANLVYREDFDLGDRVTCINKTWNVRIDARITEVTEYYEAKKGNSLEITFGESIPSVYKQIKNMVK